MTAEVKTAGSALLDQRRVMEEIAGPECVRRALASLPADVRREYEELTPLSWCSVSTARRVMEAVAKETSTPLGTFQRRVVRTGFERTVRVIHRFLLRFTSVEAIAHRASLIFGKTYSRGQLQAQVVEDGRMEAVLTEWPEVPDFDLDATCAGIGAVLGAAAKKGRAGALAQGRATGDLRDHLAGLKPPTRVNIPVAIALRTRPVATRRYPRRAPCSRGRASSGACLRAARMTPNARPTNQKRAAEAARDREWRRRESNPGPRGIRSTLVHVRSRCIPNDWVRGFGHDLSSTDLGHAIGSALT